MILDRPYNKQSFREFVDNFLPDFTLDERTVRTAKNSILTSVTQIGMSETINVTVLEVEYKEADSGKRIAITQATFRVLHEHA